MDSEKKITQEQIDEDFERSLALDGLCNAVRFSMADRSIEEIKHFTHRFFDAGMQGILLKDLISKSEKNNP